MPRHTPYLSEDDLIEKVKNQFDENNIPENLKAKLYLETIPYFNFIKGLKSSSFKNENQFKEGFNIDYLYQLSWISMNFSSIIFQFSQTVEHHLKAAISIIFKRFGETEEEYLSPNNFKRRSTSQIRYIKNLIEADTYSIFQDARDEYGLLPSWKLIDSLTFGQTIQTYKILKRDDKILMMKSFLFRSQVIISDDQISLEDTEDALELFDQMLKLSLEVRNKSAHNQRPFNMEFLTTINTETVKKMGFFDFFKVEDNGLVRANIVNFISFCMFSTKLETVSRNIFTTLYQFFYLNNLEEINPLLKIDITPYQITDIDEGDLEILKNILQFPWE